jgi:hypothetical protein
LVASESATQSVTGVGGADAVELRQPARDYGSHSPNHGVEGDDCYGAGRVNVGPTCCTGEPYWGATKKACDINQYGAPPMDRSKEDDQTGCTGKPYWGAVKKACSVDQYGAPPMDGVEGRPGGGASDGCGGPGASGARGSACGGANSGGSVQGPDGIRSGASKGARAGCEEEKADRRVTSDGAHGSAYGGTNGLVERKEKARVRETWLIPC